MHDQQFFLCLFDHEQNVYYCDYYQLIEPFLFLNIIVKDRRLFSFVYDELDGKLKIFDGKFLIKLRMNI
jgi:hypothetical protein